MAAGLKSASGLIRSGLSRLKLRIIPELRFVRDTSAEHGAHIAAILKQIEEKEGRHD